MTKIAYILAASHSGSTLLSMLLGCHPQITTVGELKLSVKAMGDISRYRCSCGQYIHQCNFWENVGKKMNTKGFDFNIAYAGTDYREVDSWYAQSLLKPMCRGQLLERLRDSALGICPTWRRQLPEIHRRNAALASTISQITKAEVIVDSSKIGLRLKYLLKNPALEVKVIHLIRDGRAVALTYMEPDRFADAQDPKLRGGGMGSIENQRMTMAQSAYAWCRCIEEAENILKKLNPSCWIKVRYEDYCKIPSATLSRLYQFLDVDPAKQPQKFRAVEQHVIGNGMRLDTTSEIRLDERWRVELTEQDLRVFNNVAGNLNRQYGYT